MKNRLAIALVGYGAVAQYIVDQTADCEAIDIIAVICRECSLPKAQKFAQGRFKVVTSISDLSPAPDLVVECAGHHGLTMHAPSILAAGIDVVSISTGAMANADLALVLENAAAQSGAKLKFLSGAIGGIDALAAASGDTLTKVTYIGRKPPLSWQGSPAEDACDLTSLTEPFTHFTGTSREAALRYPKNANVAATVALAGLGLDHTHVELIADPGISKNIHEIVAQGAFGSFRMEIEGSALASNPKTSALAAMSIVRELIDRTRPINL